MVWRGSCIMTSPAALPASTGRSSGETPRAPPRERLSAQCPRTVSALACTPQAVAVFPTHRDSLLVPSSPERVLNM